MPQSKEHTQTFLHTLRVTVRSVFKKPLVKLLVVLVSLVVKKSDHSTSLEMTIK